MLKALLQVFAVMTTDAIMGTNSQNQVDDFHLDIVYNSTSGVGLFHTLFQSRRSTLPSLSSRPVEENFEFFGIINLKLFPLNLTFTRSPYHHTSLLPLLSQPPPGSQSQVRRKKPTSSLRSHFLFSPPSSSCFDGRSAQTRFRMG